VCSSVSTEVFYVLEATCEVVGHPPLLSPVPGGASTSATKLVPPLRADWSAYIDTQSSSQSSEPESNKVLVPSLMSQLKWTNHEEYSRGISRVWLKRTQDEGEIGAAKRDVAERYVLACVVANRHVYLVSYIDTDLGDSISGRWMSSTDMAQEFNGILSDLPQWKQNIRLQLFLPA
jgi:hypothetical protein